MRLSSRVGRDVPLEKAMPELVARYGELRADFREFFPLLQASVV